MYKMYTENEIWAIKKCIKMWTKIRDADPSVYDWEIWEMKRKVYPECRRYAFDCYLCTQFNNGLKEGCPGCPLGGDDWMCEDKGPFANLEDISGGNYRKKPYFKKYCQEIINLCKEALKRQTAKKQDLPIKEKE